MISCFHFYCHLYEFIPQVKSSFPYFKELLDKRKIQISELLSMSSRFECEQRKLLNTIWNAWSKRSTWPTLYSFPLHTVCSTLATFLKKEAGPFSFFRTEPDTILASFHKKRTNNKGKTYKLEKWKECEEFCYDTCWQSFSVKRYSQSGDTVSRFLDKPEKQKHTHCVIKYLLQSFVKKQQHFFYTPPQWILNQTINMWL